MGMILGRFSPPIQSRRALFGEIDVFIPSTSRIRQVHEVKSARVSRGLTRGNQQKEAKTRVIQI